MAAITPVDFVHMAALEQMAVASIEGQNWTDKPLTPAAKILIGMAVSWTYATLKEMAHETAHRPQRDADHKPVAVSPY